MHVLDIILLAAYLLGMILFSVYLGRGQTNKDDYYVGSRSLQWWAVGLSTMATQTSAISFISIPAFVALVKNGGLKWLQYELSVPLAMIVVMAVLVPFFRSLKLVSVYEYLEMRFDRRLRKLISFVFLISRSFGTGVGVYASSVVLSTLLGTSIPLTILIVGVITVIYDTIGGMKAVVYSDVIQMVVLFAGIILAIIFGLADVGGVGKAIQNAGLDRLDALDWSHSGFDGDAAVWPFVFGGFVLYTSYYGTDQSQVQREMASSTLNDARKSLVLNGLVRFPMTLLYCFLGLILGAFYNLNPAFQQSVISPDFLVPQFVLKMIPIGAKGVIFAALLSASMSSLDSSLNSLSAATVRDFLEPFLIKRMAKNANENDGAILLNEIEVGGEGEGENEDEVENPHSKSKSGTDIDIETVNNRLLEKKLLIAGKLTTVFWGAVVTASAFVAGNVSSTAVESINLIGSAVYGPILGTFLAGLLFKPEYVNPFGMIIGVVLGVGFNIALWLLTNVYWMWWNVSGLVITLLFALIGTLLAPRSLNWSREAMEQSRKFCRINNWAIQSDENERKGKNSWLHAYIGLAIYFFALVAILIGFTSISKM